MHSHLSFENPPALPREVVVETLERALRDRSREGEAADVDGRAVDGYDDIQSFLHLW